MSNSRAKLASAFLVTAAIGLGVAATGLPNTAAKAGVGCLTEPKDATPQGRHWYYRLEHRTGHKCWYLRGEGEQSARADTPATVAAEKPAPRRQDAAATRSIADAHAELSPRTRVADDAMPAVWPNTAAAGAAPADNHAAASPLVSRWPQASDAVQTDSRAAPVERAPETSLMVADVQPDTDADVPPQQPGVPPPPVTAPPERKTGSIQTLFVVALGALALAGLTGSTVYRFGRRRQRNDWLREKTNWQSEQNPKNPPWVEPMLAQPPTRLADLDETHGVVARSDFAEAIGETEDSGERVEKIEEFLARLTAQLHQELEGTRGERDAHAPS